MHQYDDDTGPGNIARMRSLIADNNPDPALARDALATFCRRVREGRITGDRDSRDLLQWMAESIVQFLENADERGGLDAALHVRGRAPDEDRDLRIAFEVADLVRSGKSVDGEHEGSSALAIVAERNYLSKARVRNIYYSFSKKERAALKNLAELLVK